MSATVSDDEARAIAMLVDAFMNPPEEWLDEHYALAEKCASVAARWVRRDGRWFTWRRHPTPEHLMAMDALRRGETKAS